MMSLHRSVAFTAVAGAAVLVLVACSAPPPPAEARPAPRDGVFVHLSHGTSEPHRVLMALRMAELMAEDRDVLVYFDIDAVDVVLKDAPDLALEPFPSSHSQLQGLPGRGVTLMVCPGCLQAAGRTIEDVREGVRLADKEAFFGFTDGRILTIDY